MPQTIRKTRIALVGGRGFVGEKLSTYLEKQQCYHCVIDMMPRDGMVHSQKSKYRIDYSLDICDENEIFRAFSEFKPQLVVHLASYGMSGAAMLDPKCFKINYEGTQNLISACNRLSITGLVYTSTYNVVFGGREIVNGGEDTPYYEDTHTDQYAPSKTLTEKLVLSCNLSPNDDGSVLMTCSLRPAAIYGPGESRHFPRIVGVMDSGLYVFEIGNATVDWVHVDNMVQAFGRVLEKMITHITSPGDCPVGGKAYFISDGTPISQNGFLRPLCRARGIPVPNVVFPASVVLLSARVMEQIHYFGRTTGLFSYTPFLTQAEVYKVAVSHYFSIESARRDFQYSPTITSEDGAQEIANFYRSSINNKNYFRLVNCFIGGVIIIGMLLLSFFAFEPEDSEYQWNVLKQLKSLAYFLFRCRFNLQLLLAAAHVAHLYETKVAFNLCRNELKCSVWNTYAWCVQTSIFGYGSLCLLYDRVAVLQSLKEK